MVFRGFAQQSKYYDWFYYRLSYFIQSDQTWSRFFPPLFFLLQRYREARQCYGDRMSIILLDEYKDYIVEMMESASAAEALLHSPLPGDLGGRGRRVRGREGSPPPGERAGGGRGRRGGGIGRGNDR